MFLPRFWVQATGSYPDRSNLSIPGTPRHPVSTSDPWRITWNWYFMETCIWLFLLMVDVGKYINHTLILWVMIRVLKIITSETHIIIFRFHYRFQKVIGFLTNGKCLEKNTHLTVPPKLQCLFFTKSDCWKNLPTAIFKDLNSKNSIVKVFLDVTEFHFEETSLRISWFP